MAICRILRRYYSVFTGMFISSSSFYCRMSTRG